MEIEIKSGENFKFFLTRKIGVIIDEATQNLTREAAVEIEQNTKSKVVITSQSKESVGSTSVVSVISDKEHFDADKKVVSDVFEKLKVKVENKNILEIAGD